MPKWMTACFALFLSLSVFSTQAKSVDDVINNYIRAMGGREKINSLRSLYREGLVVLPDGRQLHSRTFTVQDRLYRKELSSTKGDMVVVITDKGGWISNQDKAGIAQPLPDEVVDMQQSELNCAAPLVDYAAQGHEAALLGKEVIAGIECYKIKLRLRAGQDIVYYIDPSGWKIVRDVRTVLAVPSINTGKPATEKQVTDYFDYRKNAGGLMLAHRITSVSAGTRSEYRTLIVNKPVDDQWFKAVTR